MALDMVDLVWSTMGNDEFYSLADLANSTGYTIDAVTRVLEFLTRYGFADRLTKREPIFKKIANAPAPGDVLRILRAITEDAGIGGAKRIASVLKPREHRDVFDSGFASS